MMPMHYRRVLEHRPAPRRADYGEGAALLVASGFAAGWLLFELLDYLPW